MTGEFFVSCDGVNLGLGLGLGMGFGVSAQLICYYAQLPYFSRSIPDKFEDSFIYT